MTELSTAVVTAEVADLLSEAGYSVSRQPPVSVSGSSPESLLLAEDDVAVVLVAAFEEWRSLKTGWPEAQGALVSLLSERLNRNDPKVWEGYLVLLTTEPVGPSAAREADRIRYDTNRVRKLVATGREIRTIGDIQRVILALLPLESTVSSTISQEDLLQEVVQDLEGIPPRTRTAVLGAFSEGTPMMEAIHATFGGELE